LLQQQMGLLQMGLPVITPDNIYETMRQLAINAGFKQPEQFVTNPKKIPPAPPQPDPAMAIEQMKLQADQQKFQAQAQMDQQKAQVDAQITMQVEQLKAQAKLQEVQANLELQASNDQRDSEREQQKALLDAQLEAQKIEFEKWKVEIQAQTQIYLAQLTAGSTQAVETNGNPDNVSNALAVSIDGFRSAIEQMGKPKQIIRGPDGRAQGIM